MSKGEILENKGEGLYRVRQKLAVERIQQELTQVQARLAELAVELPTAKLELIHADDAVRDKTQEIEQLIPDYAAGTEGALQKITALQNELIRLQSEAGQLRLKVAELIAEDLANRKRQNQLEQVPEGRDIEVWCADYSLELTGEVGLVDINDEGGQGTLIQPGFEDDAVYQPDRDGALFPNLAQSGAQVYLNAALLPGVQKWRPRYRIGVLSAIDGDICNVELEQANSSAQNLNINKDDTLIDVPIKYMDCDGLAFEKDDRVLVRFTQSGPLVVGFAEEPKDCGMNVYAIVNVVTGYLTGAQFLVELSSDLRRIIRNLPFPGGMESVSYGSGYPVSSLAVANNGDDIVYAVKHFNSIRFSTGPSHFNEDYFGVATDGVQFMALRGDYSDPEESRYYYDFFNLEGEYLYAVQVSKPQLDGDFYADVNGFNTDATSDRLFSVWNNFDGVPTPWEFDHAGVPINDSFVGFSPNQSFGVTESRRASLRRTGDGSGMHYIDLFKKDFQYTGSRAISGYNTATIETLRDPVFRQRNLTVFAHNLNTVDYAAWQGVFDRADALIYPTSGADGLVLGDPEILDLTDLHGFHQVVSATIDKTKMQELGGL